MQPPYQGAQHARNVSINPMLFRASRSDMSNLTDCITNESVAVTADKKPVIGRIHSFESCGTVDGPGIRFITFFQGCLMRCLYCHNRDTWDTHGGKEITVEDLMKEVVTYRHFMNASGGGVTASGGEAILQAEFVRDWFRACKKEGIHTCLDTNGFVRRYDPVIDELLDVTESGDAESQADEWWDPPESGRCL